MPPLVGYAAASGNLGLPALWLFLIVFLWTPPHFWALALLIKENYAAAKVPMLPVVRGDARRRSRSSGTRSSWSRSRSPSVSGSARSTQAAAVLLGAVFLGMAWQLRRSPTRRNAGVLFHYSLLYLALLFVAAALNPVLL